MLAMLSPSPMSVNHHLSGRSGDRRSQPAGHLAGGSQLPEPTCRIPRNFEFWFPPWGRSFLTLPPLNKSWCNGRRERAQGGKIHHSQTRSLEESVIAAILVIVFSAVSDTVQLMAETAKAMVQWSIPFSANCLFLSSSFVEHQS